MNFVITRLFKLNKEVFMWAIKFNKPHIAKIMLNIGCTIGFAAYNVLFAWILKMFIDIATHQSTMSMSLVIWIAYISTVVNGGLSVLYRINQTKIATDITYRVKTEMFQSISSAKYAEVEKIHSGDYAARVTNDLPHVSYLLVGTIDNNIQNILKVSFSYVYLFILCWPISIVIMLMGMILPIINRMMQGRLKVISQDRQQIAGKNMEFVHEFLGGLNIIRYFNLYQHFMEKLQAITKQFLKIETSSVKLNVLQSNLASFTETSIFFVAMALGAYYTSKGYMSAGSMVAFIQLLNWIIWPFTSVAGIAIQLQNALVPAERVYRICQTPQYTPVLREEGYDQRDIQERGDGIRFDQVSFSYTPNKQVLKDIRFSVHQQECLGIAGATGSGKSTIAKLIMGEYRDVEGITILGKDIRCYEDQQLYEMISYVPQDNWLFATTVYENIQFGNLQAHEQEIISAAERVKMDAYLKSLPDQYDTRVAEKGSNFSGGQKQRLALARTLLKDAPIMILDEATSAVDRASGIEIQQTVKSLLRNKCLVIISHQPELLMLCDRVLFIEEGCIVEEGTHEELMRMEGHYSKMFAGSLNLSL